MSDSAKYISCADTAKVLRRTLAANFPGVKFSVRSRTYSMGASIDVEWTDGPTTKAVEEKVGQFAGSTFDASIDLRSYHDSIHPETGEPVRWESDHIFCHRSYTAATMQSVAETVSKEWGLPCPEICTEYGQTYIKGGQEVINGGMHYQTLDREIMNALAETDLYRRPATKPAERTTGNEPQLNTAHTDSRPAAHVESFKGNPVLCLDMGNGQMFSFGKTKAAAILANLDAIKAFMQD